MTTFEKAWKRLSQSKSYREEFALAMLKRMVPFQISAIRKKKEISQAELAQSSNLTQGVISRAEDPDYGNLTLNTIGRIAAGFDLAFVGKFVSFGELVRLTVNLSEDEFANLPTFSKEDERVRASGVDALAMGAGKDDSKESHAGEGKNKSGIHQLAAEGRSEETKVPKDIKDLAKMGAARGGGQNEYNFDHTS